MDELEGERKMSTIDWSEWIKIKHFGGCIWFISFLLDKHLIVKELKKEKMTEHELNRYLRDFKNKYSIKRKKRGWATIGIGVWHLLVVLCGIIVLTKALSILIR